MPTHDFLHRGDWMDAATRYLIDKAELSQAHAEVHARELAEQMAGEHGPDPEDWPAPENAAHELAVEDLGVCDEDDAD